MNWSEKQLAVFADAATGIGHTMVNAVAGGGKTTVLLEAMRHVPKGKSCCFVAFNKSIATELAKRAPSGVEVSTLHSLGLRAVTRAIGRAKIDGDKCRTIADRVTGADVDSARREWSRSVAKVVSLCKGQLAATDEEIEEVIDQHGVVPPEREEEHPSFVLDVQKVLQASLDDTKTIDFATGVEDTRECLHALSEGETDLDAVVRRIEQLFADGDDSARIVLSSTHKAKGLERDRVWLLRDTYMRRRFKKIGGSFEQQPIDISEQNLLYVAQTRARRELYLVRGGV